MKNYNKFILGICFLISYLGVSVQIKAMTSSETNEHYPDMFYEYTVSPESFYVYEKLTNEGHYIKFRINHQVSVNTNSNLWRVLQADYVKYDGSKMTVFQNALTVGENEFVWKSSRPEVKDATGGYHGDERVDVDPSSKVSFYIDNELIEPKSNIGLTACNSFYYEQFSTMHQTGTGGLDFSNSAYVGVEGNPIECYHLKRTTFERKGYKTYNKLTWMAQVPINVCYIGLLCVNKEMTTIGQNENNQTVVFNEDGKQKLNSSKQKIEMENPVLGTSVTCNSRVLSLPFTPSLSTYILDHTYYHKYYSRFGSVTTNVNDVWEVEAEIYFDFSSTGTSVSTETDIQKLKFIKNAQLLIIDGLEANDEFFLYNTKGQLIQRGDAKNNSFSNQHDSIYILHLRSSRGNKVYKILHY